MKTISEKLYDFPSGGYSGVLIPKKVMVKIVKLQAKYARELREVLTEHQDLLYASDWTLANKLSDSGEILKQVTINYVDKDNRSKVPHRIELFGPVKPRDVGNVYLVSDYEQAKEVAEKVLRCEL